SARQLAPIAVSRSGSRSGSACPGRQKNSCPVERRQYCSWRLKAFCASGRVSRASWSKSSRSAASLRYQIQSQTPDVAARNVAAREAHEFAAEVRFFSGSKLHQVPGREAPGVVRLADQRAASVEAKPPP